MTSPVSRSSEHSISLGWLDALTRYRTLVYTLVACVYLLSFNGIWRVGTDSALYRGLARSIARGEGYVFAGEHHRHAYAGLPLLLAGLEKVFGESEMPGQIMITLMALATLWLIDAMLRLRYPLWVATIITIGVGVNFRFVRQSTELMTDIPFTLGVMMSLYAYERFRETLDRRRLIQFSTVLLAGLVLAAATRPTFGVVVIALVLGSTYAAIFKRDGTRGRHLAIVGASLFVILLLVRFDPRTALSSPFSGKYELEMRDALRILPTTFLGQLRQFLNGNLNDAFFSQRMSPVEMPSAILLLIGSVLVWRRNAVWGILIFGIFLVTLPLSTVPRYYLMIMPMLWLGWLILLSKLVLRSPRILQGAIMMVGIGLPMTMNLGRTLGLIIEQRRGDWEWIMHGADRRQAFYAHFQDGVVQTQYELARLIADNTQKHDTIIGPWSNVLSYVADRRVLGERSLFFERMRSAYPSILKKVAPDYVIFPRYRYEDSDPAIKDLIRRKVIVATKIVARSGNNYLAVVEIHDSDFSQPAPPVSKVVKSKKASTKRFAQTQPASTQEASIKKKPKPTTIRASTGPSKAEKAEIQRRKERRLEREKQERKERLARQAAAKKKEAADKAKANKAKAKAIKAAKAKKAATKPV